MNWYHIDDLPPKEYSCGYCSKLIASARGYHTGANGQSSEASHFVYICPNCKKPTYFHHDKQIPGVAPGNEVTHVPDNVHHLYFEARNCVAAGCYTSAVLACRKLLMNIAVDQGADEGKNFVHYIEHLANKGFVPPNGKGWVDHIRKKGNEANHEIVLMGKADAEELILFSEMLLKFIYEFPNRVPSS